MFSLLLLARATQRISPRGHTLITHHTTNKRTILLLIAWAARADIRQRATTTRHCMFHQMHALNADTSRALPLRGALEVPPGGNIPMPLTTTTRRTPTHPRSVPT